MIEPTDIEKKSLEAHVELCAERYNSLDDRIDHLNQKIDKVDGTVTKVHDMVLSMSKRQSDRIIQWGGTFIGALFVVIGWLVTNYILEK